MASASTFPPLDGSAPKTQKFSAAPELGIDPSKRYTATIDTSLGELVVALDAAERAEDGQQLRVPRPAPLLRRRHLPPHHQRLHVPGRRPDRHRPRRPRLPVRGRAAQARPLRDRLGGDGQRRPEHQRQPVLHRLRPERRRPAAAVQPVRQGREGSRRRRRRCSACRPAARTARRTTSSSTRSRSPSRTDRWPARSPGAPRSSPAPAAASARRSPPRSTPPAPASRSSPAPSSELDEDRRHARQRPGHGRRRPRHARRPASGRRRRRSPPSTAASTCSSTTPPSPSASRATSSPPTRSSTSSTSTSAVVLLLTRRRAAGDARRRLGLDRLDQLDQRPARHAAPRRVRREQGGDRRHDPRAGDGVRPARHPRQRRRARASCRRRCGWRTSPSPE